jgi:hypothetical protein
MLIMVMSFTSCTQNYSNGERVGFLTKFSNKGLIWKSWEGSLNLTQTGMNSSGEPFSFSIDNDREPDGLITQLDSAATFGWKVKLRYHETFGLNWFRNRGETNMFVTSCEVLDKNPNAFMNNPNQPAPQTTPPVTLSQPTKDTVWVEPYPELK